MHDESASDRLFTVTEVVEATLEEKNSRFLTRLLPYADLAPQLAEMQRLHPKAVHHVTAWRCFNDRWRIEEKGRDDGEPGGTAGMPALRVLQGAGLIQVAVIITRYFGGVKLGTGGLARAYGGAAKLAVAAARQERKIIAFVRQATLTLRADFGDSGALEQLCADPRIEISARQFNESGVALSLAGPEDLLAALEEAWETRRHR